MSNDSLPEGLYHNPTQCPHCGTKHKHTGGPDKVPPAAGSWSLCYFCGGVAVFEDSAEGLVQRMPTIEETKWMDKDPHMQQLLRVVRHARDTSADPAEAYRKLGLS